MSTNNGDLVRIFVNATAVDVPVGSSVRDAVRQWNQQEAAAVDRGDRIITDSRGLPIPADVRVSAGSIFRLIPARKRTAAQSDVDLDDVTDDS